MYPCSVLSWDTPQRDAGLKAQDASKYKISCENCLMWRIYCISTSYVEDLWEITGLCAGYVNG